MTKNSAEVQFKSLTLQITKNINNLDRHDTIRLKHWLQKLETPVMNQVWKHNRNFYLKVLKQMVIIGKLMCPFNMVPPQGPLPKLTIYDIPFPIRNKITQSQSKTQRKSQVNSKDKEYSTSRNGSVAKVCQNQDKLRYKKRISFDIISERLRNESIQKSENDMNLFNVRERQNQFQKTIKIKKIQHKVVQRQSIKESKFDRKSKKILEASLKLLGQYHEDFQQSLQYKLLLEKIVNIGDLLNTDFRNVVIPVAEQKIRKRLNCNFVETNKNSQQFMNYLNSLN